MLQQKLLIWHKLHFPMRLQFYTEWLLFIFNAKIELEELDQEIDDKIENFVESKKKLIENQDRL